MKLTTNMTTIESLRMNIHYFKLEILKMENIKTNDAITNMHIEYAIEELTNMLRDLMYSYSQAKMQESI
jgi:hypothetical protein